MRKVILSIFALAMTLCVKADEGMWMLQLMKEQHVIDQMKKCGLRIEADDVYSTTKPSLKDCVGIFGGGCTGEVVSADGLVLTNHHCGFDAIQGVSTDEHNYLKNGYWAKSRSEELATKNLAFTFIVDITDVTEEVENELKEMKDKKSASGIMTASQLRAFAQKKLAASKYSGKAGYRAECLPFFAGNSYYLFIKKIYKDVRLVGTPPQCVGKFGGETDNWMWPRHTCDFSMFRIYADKNGEPADFSTDNVPLKCPKHLAISLKELNEGDYAMVMGFPGSTERYLTASEIKVRMDSENTPRIIIRTERQRVLKEAMQADPSIALKYASKYAHSANYWKNAIGMNKAIVDNKVIEGKLEQEKAFATFAEKAGNSEYETVVSLIDALMKDYGPFYRELMLFVEFRRAIEFKVDDVSLFSAYADKKGTDEGKALEKKIRSLYDQIHNKDYDHKVDADVLKALLPLYAKEAKQLPTFYKEVIEKNFKGNYNAFVDDMYSKSILANEANLNKFLAKPSAKVANNDLMLKFSASMRSFLQDKYADYSSYSDKANLLHKIYVRGLCKMNEKNPVYSDANFTLRMTYGNVKGYSPKDALTYRYYTTLEGVMQKEDPNNDEFEVPQRLKDLFQKKDYGRYANKDGKLVTCFLTTNDITGGNSGSPVINADGQLIGLAFDGNWESLSGDIHFDNELQRCICVDIRYVLFMIDKFGGCPQIVQEMTIAE